MAEITGNRRRPDPHERGWFYDILDLFGLRTHPQAEDRESDDQTPYADAWWASQFTLGTDRRKRYEIFEEMDTFDLIQASMDVYAEEVTQVDNDRERTVWVESKDPKFVNAANDFFTNVMMEDQAFALARRTALLGDSIRRLVYQTGKGILSWQFVHPRDVDRVKDKYNRLIGFRQAGMIFRPPIDYPTSWPWDYVHFRVLGKDDNSDYGSSFAAPMHRPWRLLTLYEDSGIRFVLKRSGAQNVFFVDVGNEDEDDAIEHVKSFAGRFSQKEYVDPSSPAYKRSANPWSPVGDVFIPVRPGDAQSSRVEPLVSSATFGDKDLLDHYRNKFFAASRIPKSYMGWEGDVNAKATLAQQDVRFARGLKRLRRTLIYGTRNALDIHYALLNQPGEERQFDLSKSEYEVKMPAISYLDEYERLELAQVRAGIVEQLAGLGQSLALNGKVWAAYVLVNFARLPEKIVTRLLAKADAASPPKGPGGLGGQFGEEEKDDGSWSQGYGDISAAERRAIDDAIAQSPLLGGKLLEFAGYLREPDGSDVARRQTDPSLLPPIGPDGRAIALHDSVTENDERGKLVEHVRKLSRPLNEG